MTARNAAPSSFDLPMRLMGTSKRHAMHALYDFCRRADDAADDSADAEEARKKLMALRAGIYNIYGNPKLQSSDPLKSAIAQYGLQRAHFDSILDGMEMDATGQMLRPTLEALSLYCYRVASCVGLLAIPIFGEAGAAAEKFAIALGHALQLTNILRDIHEDAARGRLYLPQEWLNEEGIGDIAPDGLVAEREAVNRVCAKVANLAERFFLEAEALSRLCSRRHLLPALVMRDIYLEQFLAIGADGNYLNAKPLRLRFWQKLYLGAGALLYLV
jgi:phytoene synthase